LIFHGTKIIDFGAKPLFEPQELMDCVKFNLLVKKQGMNIKQPL